jgi:hypothetical protein
MFKLPEWWPTFGRDDTDREAPTFGSEPEPREVYVSKPAPRERWLRDDPDDSSPSIYAPSGGSAAAAPLIVNGRKIKQSFSLDLSVARTNERFALDGNVFIFNDSAAGTDRIKVRLARNDGDQSCPVLTLRPGQEVGGEEFKVLLITNIAHAAGTVAEIWIAEEPGGLPFIYR